MKIVYLLLSALMVLFAAVQYNDPDAVYWMAIYLVPAVAAAVAAFRAQLLASGVVFPLLVLCVAAGIAGSAYLWPTEPEFWRQEVWWNSETAREGMGFMAATFVMIVAFLAAWRARRRRRAAA